MNGKENNNSNSTGKLSSPPNFQHRRTQQVNQNGNKLRVSYQLIDQTINESKMHRFSVNSLVIDETKNRLYTAGRDSTVRSWDIQNPTIEHLNSFEHHSNWVNDILLCNEKILATCSSDTTVKLWNISDNDGDDGDDDKHVNENINKKSEIIKIHDQQNNTQKKGKENKCVCTFEGHKDYVMRIAYSKQNRLLASAGLDKQILIWDIEKGISFHSPSSFSSNSFFEPDSHFLSRTIEDNKGSIYALSVSDEGNLIIYGGTEKIIKGWDIRSPRISFKLKGHHDIVRSLKSNYNATKIASASSDSTIKIWDIGMQRCFKTYAMHDDSVWNLAVDRSFTYLFSSGRDQNVYLTDLVEGKSTLLLKEKNHILYLYLTNDQQSIWVSTFHSGVHNYRFNNQKNEIIDGDQSRNNNVCSENNSNTVLFCQNRDNSENYDYSSSPMSPNFKNLNQYFNQNNNNNNDDDDYDVKNDNDGDDDVKHDIKNDVKSLNNNNDIRNNNNNTLLFTSTEIIQNQLQFIQNHINNNNKSNDDIILKRKKDNKEENEEKDEDKESNLHLQHFRSIITQPGIIKYHILNDRVHVLSKDSNGLIQLWNVCQAKKIKDIGYLEWDDILPNYHFKISIPNWFSLDAKIGSLTVHMDASQCFNAEIDPNEINLTGPQMNIGERVLRSLFRIWIKRRIEYFKMLKNQKLIKNNHSSSSSSNNNNNNQNDGDEHHNNNDDDDDAENNKLNNDRKLHDNNNNNDDDDGDEKHLINDPPKHDIDRDNDINNLDVDHKQSINDEPVMISLNDDDDNVDIIDEDENDYFFMSNETPLIISNNQTGQTIIKTSIGEISHFCNLPQWVSNCIIKGEFTPRENNRIFFYLKQANGEKLPALPEGASKLSAFRGLKVGRIAHYLIRNMKLSLPFVDLNNNIINPLDNSSADIKDDEKRMMEPEEYLEILCRGEVLNVDLHLATLKTFYWKSSEDMVIQYRRKRDFQHLPLRRISSIK